MNLANAIPNYASELPIESRARAVNSSLYYIQYAKDFCSFILRDRNAYHFTPDEWSAIESVAAGGAWPVPDHPYTDDDWNRDSTFSPAPGQEITESIYEHMFNVLPPYRLPRCKRTEGLSGGFLVSEPVTHDLLTGKALYTALGRSGDHYYYLGLLPAHVDD